MIYFTAEQLADAYLDKQGRTLAQRFVDERFAEEFQPMTMPPIADVKAAAERAVNLRYECGALGTLTTSDVIDATLLASFALAVLDAPGMSAERLEKIQRYLSDYLPQTTEGFFARELLAEVLRLRAACASVVTAFDHAAATKKYDECQL